MSLQRYLAMTTHALDEEKTAAREWVVGSDPLKIGLLHFKLMGRDAQKTLSSLTADEADCVVRLAMTALMEAASAAWAETMKDGEMP